MISPYPAGSASDTVTRVVLDQVSQLIGQPMVIDLKPGAGGATGFATVARSDPDGYTLVTSSSSMATESVLHSKLPYDPIKDFVHVVLLGTSPNILVASAKSGFKTVADLVAAAKAKPGTLDIRLGGHRLLLAHGGRAVPARRQDRRPPCAVQGRRPGAGDGGNIDFYFIPLAAAASALEQRQAHNPGRELAQARGASLPNVPTVVEAGYPGAVFRFWNGISAPAKTPPDVVKKLHDVTEQALKMPAVQEKLAKLGVEPAQISSEEFGEVLQGRPRRDGRTRQESQYQAGRLSFGGDSGPGWPPPSHSIMEPPQ